MRLAIALLAIASLLGCAPEETPDDRAETAKRMADLRGQVGLPKITNFTEAKFANLTAELKDQEIRTWAYYVDMDGGRHLLCEAIGYGLPYSTQITNPLTIEDRYEGDVAIPQAEPNGLYMPESAEATWVICSDGKGGAAPVYSEERLIVSPFPLGHVDAAQSSGFADQVEIKKLPPSKNPS